MNAKSYAALIFTGVFLAGSALAAPKPKSTVLHCGCNELGDGMEYSEIVISAKSKGHDGHVSTSTDACFDGVDTWTDFVRTGSDCQVAGPPLGEPIADCDAQLAGDVCGALLID